MDRINGIYKIGQWGAGRDRANMIFWEIRAIYQIYSRPFVPQGQPTIAGGFNPPDTIPSNSALEGPIKWERGDAAIGQ